MRVAAPALSNLLHSRYQVPVPIRLMRSSELYDLINEVKGANAATKPPAVLAADEQAAFRLNFTFLAMPGLIRSYCRRRAPQHL